ncbi:hypothetical protein LBMAG42_36360 [Deltaproteobacteria bacterium]|nr:hypothetical protein LBMAG42_36360 [Deltaproteobacteria bacterium]
MVPDADAPPRTPVSAADPTDSTPGRLRLDHELLARLGPQSGLEEWEAALRRAGLLRLEGGDSERGAILAELQALLAEWRARAPTTVADSISVSRAIAAAVAFGTAVFVTVAIPDGLIPGLLLGAAVGGLTWFWGSPTAARADATGARAHSLLRRLLSGSFVDVIGGLVLEHVPQRDYLVLRLEEVEACVAAADGRLVDLAATIEGIRAANARLGHAADDEDIARLGLAIALETHARQRLVEAAARLRIRLDRLDIDLERLHDQAARLALSARAARLTDGGAIDRSMQVAASLEVDVPEIEAELAPLAVASKANDARIRALLEMVSATRPRR